MGVNRCLDNNTNIFVTGTALYITAKITTKMSDVLGVEPSNKERTNTNRWKGVRNLRIEECGAGGDCAYHVLSKASEYDIYSNTYSAVNIKESVVKELTDNMEDYDGFITNDGNEERGVTLFMRHTLILFVKWVR